MTKELDRPWPRLRKQAIQDHVGRVPPTKLSDEDKLRLDELVKIYGSELIRKALPVEKKKRGAKRRAIRPPVNRVACVYEYNALVEVLKARKRHVLDPQGKRLSPQRQAVVAMLTEEKGLQRYPHENEISNFNSRLEKGRREARQLIEALSRLPGRN